MYAKAFAIIITTIFCQNLYAADWQWNKYKSKNKKPSSHLAKKSVSNDIYFSTDLRKIVSQLKKLAQSSDLSLNIQLPTSSGDLVTYVINYSPIYQASYQNDNPQFFSFSGRQIDDKSQTGRFDIGVNGFNGVYMIDGKTYYLDSTEHDKQQLQKLYLRPENKGGFSDQINELVSKDSDTVDQSARVLSDGQGDVEYTTYRLAISATGEYTAYWGGLNQAANGIATTINRVNQIFERDLAVSLQLVANNNALIQRSAQNDPYENVPGLIDLEENQRVVDNIIGSDNYDVGHLFMTGDGGFASVGVVCNSAGHKAEGVTGLSSPKGDAFAVEYFAHELGHQFGADHTFNGDTHGCAGQRSSGSAVEPGSGSSIMSYAGICGKENIQFSSDDYFHAQSLKEINHFLNNGGGQNCGIRNTLNNSKPKVDAGKNHVIPAHTPFVLTGGATDEDGDDLTYSWEQMDIGNLSTTNIDLIDKGQGPLFRSWPLSDSPKRYFPRLKDVIDGSLVKGEAYATTNRTLDFSLTVRDNHGGVSHDDTRIRVSADAGPFVINQPNSNEALIGGDKLVLEWDVANTNLPPVSCLKLDVLFSLDRGRSFEHIIASDIDNNGRTIVTIPNVDASAKLMLKCVSNLFFAIAPSTLTVQHNGLDLDPVATPDTVELTQGDEVDILPLSNDFDDKLLGLELNSWYYSGSNLVQQQGDRLYYSADSDFVGSDVIEYEVVDSTGQISSATIQVTVIANNINNLERGSFLPSEDNNRLEPSLNTSANAQSSGLSSNSRSISSNNTSEEVSVAANSVVSSSSSTTSSSGGGNVGYWGIFLLLINIYKRLSGKLVC